MTYDIPTGTQTDVSDAMNRIQTALVENGPFTDSNVDIWVNQNGQIHVDLDREFEEFPVRQNIESAEEVKTHLDNAWAALIGMNDDDLLESFEEWWNDHEDDLNV